MVPLAIFRNFVPTHSLSPSDRAELARHSKEVRLARGQSLFNRGDRAETIAYLISGEVELVNEFGTRSVRGGTEEARHPLCTGGIRSVTATARADSNVLLVGREQLDMILTWAQTGAVEVHDVEDEDSGDWMAAMLRSPALHRIPPSNIAQIIASVAQIDYPAGGEIIREGDPGDCYFVITAGECEVSRHNPRSGVDERLGILRVGSGFGEEALVSGEPRNATVRAHGDCSVARLSAKDFHRLLQTPLLHGTSLGAAPPDSLRVDVRLPEEYAHGHLPGAVNLPLRDIRELTAGMKPGAMPLLVYCDSGRRSASAAFLLRERGFEAHFVEDGVPNERLTDTQDHPLPG